MSASAASTGQSPALLARVNEKKAELENLKELRNLSASMASQMEALEQKLATLSDGTEAIALVLANWHNVLRAINMASGMPFPPNRLLSGSLLTAAAKLPKPSAEEGAASEHSTPLPQTLVRIPTEHAPILHEVVAAAEEERD